MKLDMRSVHRGRKTLPVTCPPHAGCPRLSRPRWPRAALLPQAGGPAHLPPVPAVWWPRGFGRENGPDPVSLPAEGQTDSGSREPRGAGRRPAGDLLTHSSLSPRALLAPGRGGQVFGDRHGLVAVLRGVTHGWAFLPWGERRREREFRGRGAVPGTSRQRSPGRRLGPTWTSEEGAEQKCTNRRLWGRRPPS